jgi:hypothetical protein
VNLLLLLVVALLGCETTPADADVDGLDPAVDERDSADDSAVEAPVDADADGYVKETDCDDGNAAVHPGASEGCNGQDDDCDGLIDDEDDGLDVTTASVWHPDGDEDTFGAMDTSATACVAPMGWIVDASDCDDGDRATYPGAAETCDTEDQDCDGLVDESCAPAPTGEHRVTEYPLRLTGEGPYFGVFLAGLGDIDADGSDDLLVASGAEGSGESTAGAVWLVGGAVVAATEVTTVEPLLPLAWAMSTTMATTTS